MCGISGALVFDGGSFQVCHDYLVRMRDTMAHRGPDGTGVWIGEQGRVGLGHRRLSIIDLSEAAAQPMSNEDGSLWLSFNGEIYNHAEIRAELERIGGHRWATDHSDTEVIIHAFEEWGIDCLHRFRGMFAFAIWDVRRRELWLVRDRIGVKPLYYSIHHGRLTFASEIKALLADPEQPRAVNEEAFYHYLSFVTTPAPDTLFRGIHKLAAGTWLRIRPDGDVFRHRYYEMWDHTIPLTGASEDEIAERVLDELRTAVQLRKVADVPVGVFLSGGVDSSTNAALFSEGETGPVRTFSIGYTGQNRSYTNELHFARSMADRVGAEYHERLLSMDDLLEFLPRMVHLQDEPLADPVCVPLHYVSDLARRSGVVVAQVGEGADELFCGYQSWPRILGLQAASDRFPFPAAKGLAAGILGRHPRLRYNPNVEFLRRAGEDRPIFWGGSSAFPEPQKAHVLHPRLRRALDGLSTWTVIEPLYERFREKAWEPSAMNWMSFMDLNVRLPELLLMRVDKMSMGVSLECRVPFLDHRFVELALSIPDNVKVRGSATKRVLKKAVRGVIPDELIDRPKQGFDVPLYDWLFEPAGAPLLAELEDFCAGTEFLDGGEVRRLIRERRAMHVWFLINFALWHKHWIG
jgi:asparagine synthase (glutamine-hydrolysing)